LPTGKVDKDGPKKAITDAKTKALPELGFNADIFLGRFDDNKYLAEVEREFAKKATAEAVEAIEQLAATKFGDGAADWIEQKVLARAGVTNLSMLTQEQAQATVNKLNAWLDQRED
jgi:hypothetical protein